MPDEVIVIDNDPESSACPDPIPGLPLRIVHAGLGLNLAGARNLGWRSTSSSVCVFIDDDNAVEPEAIDELARVFEDREVGLAGPVIYSGDEAIVWCAGIRRSPWTTRTRWPLHGQWQLPDEQTWPTDDMPDAFAVPRTVLEAVGGLDEERFPFHYDEADLGARIRALGFRGVVVRDARVRHYSRVKLSVGDIMVRGIVLDDPDGARFSPGIGSAFARSAIEAWSDGAPSRCSFPCGRSDRQRGLSRTRPRLEDPHGGGAGGGGGLRRRIPRSLPHGGE